MKTTSYVLLFQTLGIVKQWKKKTEFCMEDCLSLRGLGKKNFNSLGTENDEAIFIYNDKYMKFLVRQSIEEGRCAALYQYYNYENCDDVLNHISKEINIKCNNYDIINA